MEEKKRIVLKHSGYRNLKSYQMAEIVYDATACFCDRFIDRRSRKHNQMVQAARSGMQNIAEGSMASGTSKKIELKLVGIARAGLEELLQDYQDFLRQRDMSLWDKDDRRALKIRRIGSYNDSLYTSYKIYFEKSSAEVAANTIICIVHQTNYLLDQLLRKLEKDFINNGGITGRSYSLRKSSKNSIS